MTESPALFSHLLTDAFLICEWDTGLSDRHLSEQ